jgi:hypothetical protein
VKVIGVEATDAAGMTESLRQDRVVTLPTVGLFADGAAVATVGDETFRLCREHVDEMVTVSTDEICAAIKQGWVRDQASQIFFRTFNLQLEFVPSTAGLKIATFHKSHRRQLQPFTSLIGDSCKQRWERPRVAVMISFFAQRARNR